MKIIDPAPALEELAAAARTARIPALTRLAAAASALAKEFRQPSEPAAEHAKIIGREMQQLSAAIAAADRAQLFPPDKRRMLAALKAARRELGEWVKANPALNQENF